jgi:hypothetical protein
VGVQQAALRQARGDALLRPSHDDVAEPVSGQVLVEVDPSPAAFPEVFPLPGEGSGPEQLRATAAPSEDGGDAGVPGPSDHDGDPAVGGDVDGGQEELRQPPVPRQGVSAPPHLEHGAPPAAGQ